MGNQIFLHCETCEACFQIVFWKSNIFLSFFECGNSCYSDTRCTGQVQQWSPRQCRHTPAEVQLTETSPAAEQCFWKQNPSRLVDAHESHRSVTFPSFGYILKVPYGFITLAKHTSAVREIRFPRALRVADIEFIVLHEKFNLIGLMQGIEISSYISFMDEIEFFLEQFHGFINCLFFFVFQISRLQKITYTVNRGRESSSPWEYLLTIRNYCFFLASGKFFKKSRSVSMCYL